MLALDLNATCDRLVALLNANVAPPAEAGRFQARATVPEIQPDPALFYLSVAAVDHAAPYSMGSTDVDLEGVLFAANLEQGVDRAQRALNGFLGNGPTDIWGILMVGETLDPSLVDAGVRAVMPGRWERVGRLDVRIASDRTLAYTGAYLRIRLMTR